MATTRGTTKEATREIIRLITKDAETGTDPTSSRETGQVATIMDTTEEGTGGAEATAADSIQDRRTLRDQRLNQLHHFQSHHP